jgi:hypothetical protein
MSTLKKTVLALAMSATVILPAAAAEGIVDDGTSYSRQQSEKYMQNRSQANQSAPRANVRGFFLEDRRTRVRDRAPVQAAPSDRRETPAGFGG